MIGEFDVGGVLLSSVFVTGVIALACAFVLRRLLTWAGAYRLVWHPALFDLALFVILWAAIAALPFPAPLAR
ncbi:DUF1656 domain-containing protein [Caulobacter sp. KR2-114]|uniref:DUF1656 domain-containing protein n=1 Tax=Caulobacter sp. KR2-114 TaxID=3400912 RepID=UPI003C0B1A56